jgi:hypothetical protein
METSENVSDLNAALAKVQGEVENARKNSENPHFKSRYADLASILEILREPLSRHGISVTQSPEEFDGNFYLSTYIGHASGQWIKTRARLLTEKLTSQAMGSSISYMRRYTLASLFLIAQTDDDGNEASNCFIDDDKAALLETIAPLGSQLANKILTPLKISSYREVPEAKFTRVLKYAISESNNKAGE